MSDAEGRNRRSYERFDVTELSVDYASGETFLFSYIANISEMGIFVRSDTPLPIGTALRLRFSQGLSEPFELHGEVVWVNPVRVGGDSSSSGMGVRFVGLSAEQRDRIVALVRTIAYLPPSDG